MIRKINCGGKTSMRSREPVSAGVSIAPVFGLILAGAELDFCTIVNLGSVSVRIYFGIGCTAVATESARDRAATIAEMIAHKVLRRAAAAESAAACADVC